MNLDDIMNHHNQLIDLVKIMGSVIRDLDEDCVYCEYWLNDGEGGTDYVPALEIINQQFNT